MVFLKNILQKIKELFPWNKDSVTQFQRQSKNRRNSVQSAPGDLNAGNKILNEKSSTNET